MCSLLLDPVLSPFLSPRRACSGGRSVLALAYEQMRLRTLSRRAFNFFKCLFLREREREREREGSHAGEQRRDTDRKRISCRLHTVNMEPHAGLEPKNCEIMT